MRFVVFFLRNTEVLCCRFSFLSLQESLQKKKITKTQKITSYFFQETHPRFTITLSPPIWNFFRLLWKTEKKMFGYDFDHLLLIDSFFSTSFEDASKLLVVVVGHDKGRLFWGGCRNCVGVSLNQRGLFSNCFFSLSQNTVFVLSWNNA